MKKIFSSLCALMVCFSSHAFAAKTTYLSEGEMKVISVSEDIESVFVSNPTIADYQVIDKRKVALFAKVMGNTGFAVFGQNGKTLVQHQVHVNFSLAELEQKVALLHPKAEVKLTHIADNVVLTGTVPNEQIKDNINQMVGELLERERTEFAIEWDLDAFIFLEQRFQPVLGSPI